MINDKKKYYDNHIHSDFSHDSDAAAEDEILTGIEAGLTGMCFTEHNDFDYKEPDGNDAFTLNLEGYLCKAAELQDKYRDRLDILVGLEQGLTMPAAERIESYDLKKRLDFIIGSTHVVDGLDPYYPEFWEDHDAISGVRRYYENMFECVCGINDYDVYGHLDYITRYIPKKYGENRHEKLTPLDLVQEILKNLIYKGKGIEINTAGWRKGDNPNPAAFILREYKRLGGDIITVGSDAHKCEHIAYGIKKAHALLEECGFRYACVFRRRKAEYYTL